MTLSQTVSEALVPKTAPEPIKTALARMSGLAELDELYATVRSSRKPIIPAVIEALDIRLSVADSDLARIPKTGAVIVVANHPTGMLDGLVAARVLQRVRSDLRILGNELLSAVPELADLVIPVDLTSSVAAVKTNAAAIRRALEHVAAGGLLLIFPAGEVSRIQWREREIADSGWSPSVVRLIRAAARQVPRLPVAPLHLSASNTAMFHAAGALHPELRLAMLPRQLLNKRGSEVGVRIGHSISASKLAEMGDDRDCAAYLRWRTYLLAKRPAFKAQTNAPLRRAGRLVQPAALIPAVPANALRDEIGSLAPDRKLVESDGLTAYLASAAEIPQTLTEISRLREITFRAAGEGTGRACDRDAFDDEYQHLFLWNEAKAEIAGAYRLARTAAVRDLYTATLFSYDPSFLDQMGPAIELGRSFVRLEYQRSFAPLLLLWKGIGQFVARHPECKVLFGPVSISNQYQNISREMMVAYLERRAPLTEWLGMVASRFPFRPRLRLPQPACDRFELDDLSSVIADIEPDGRGVPVLLRQYLKLGGRLLGFNIDPEFSNALDGLIVVDLTRTERKLLERYLGKAESAAFLEFHKEAYAA